MGCEICTLASANPDGSSSSIQLKMAELPPAPSAPAASSSDPAKTAASAVSQSVSLQFLAQVKLFKRLPKDQYSTLQQICVPLEFPPGHALIKQGDEGNEFYVIVTGSVQVSVDGKNVATLTVGDYFGELALLRVEPRTATITAATPLSVLQITREKFQESGLINKLEFAKRQAVGGGAEAPLVTKPPSNKTAADRAMIMKGLKSNVNLSAMVELDDARCNAMCDVAWEEVIPQGKDIIVQGSDEADYFYIVKQGTIAIHIDQAEGEGQSADAKLTAVNSQVGVVAAGGSFGELALIYYAPRAATCRAAESATVWVIDRANFKQIIAKTGSEIAKKTEGHLERHPFFKELQPDERVEVAKSMTETDFVKGDNIFDQGESGTAFHILVDGEVAAIKDGKETARLKGSAEKAEIFGETGLLAPEKRAATMQVVSATAKTFTLDQLSFELVLGPLGDIKKRGAGGESKAGKGGKKIEAPPAPSNQKKVNFKDLKKLGLLGCGGFGAVDLVEHKVTKDSYALKALSKGHVVKCRMQKSVMSEKSIQHMCDSTFIVKLYECFNEPQSLLFLLELALGGELYDTYCKKGFHGSLKHAQFYVAGTTFAFEHLHAKKVIFRDLKPENLLLAEGGKIKLTDMGLAKVVVGKTNTTCGTPDYFAPEVIGSAGHNHAVDWYTLGILCYELMAGNPPFESPNPSQTMGKIQKGILKANFPSKLKGVCEDLVKNLCNKNPTDRLPMKKGGIENIKSHAWFKDFDWVKMLDLTLDAPYKPEVKSKTDLKNFSASAADKPPQIPYKDDGSGWDKDFATST